MAADDVNCLINDFEEPRMIFELGPFPPSPPREPSVPDDSMPVPGDPARPPLGEPPGPIPVPPREPPPAPDRLMDRLMG